MAQREPATGAPGTVVVPLDGSDVAARAVPVGADLARGFGAELVLVTTTQTTRADRMVRPVWLDEAAASVSGTPVRTEFLDEHPADAAICTVAQRAPDTTICMATHGRGAIGTAILGSVARDVIRDAERPVVLVGPHVDGWSGHGQPMIVCHDGSQASAAIVPVAAAWAKALGTPVVVAHVFHPLDVASAQAPTAAVDAIVAELRETIDDVDLRVTRDSYPVGAILELARTLPASIVALSTHGRTGLARITLGSVAASLAHASPCPLLTVRPRELA
jgi:nucleotide-binding universal stress UspA family protein